MKTLNTRRCELLKSEKIAVLNEGGTIDELNEVLKMPFRNTTKAEGTFKFYFNNPSLKGFWNYSQALPDGYTAHPISWFYEQDEAVKPTTDELKQCINDLLRVYVYDVDNVPMPEMLEIVERARALVCDGEAEIIGWELMIDVPELLLKAGDKTVNTGKHVASFSNRASIFKSIIRQIGMPIYKRTTAQIIHDLVCGRISEDEAVKELEQTKTA